MLQLHRFSESLMQSYSNREPSVLCEYLYTLAQKFSTFYSEIPVNGEVDYNKKLSRLKLLKVTRDILVQGLKLLGIEAPERMAKRK